MKKLQVIKLLLAIGAVGLRPTAAEAQSDSLPADLPLLHYHLTARPWSPLNIPKTAYLDRLEGECRFWIKHQDASGAIIDPFTNTETEYSTPYFAHALGTLLGAGRAMDLLSNGQKAMEHATNVFASGGAAEFWIAPLTEAIELYAQHVPAGTLDTWKSRMRIAFSPGGNTNNWRTYFMKGQWLRSKASFISKTTAVADVENNWNGTQKGDIAPTKWSLYHDHTSDPDTLAVETVGRGNLLALAATGYDGPSAPAIRSATETGTKTSLLLMDPSGQMPTNGRTDNHVWGDVCYQLAFETMAEQSLVQGDKWLAGQYRHAALLTFQNIDRWRRTDGAWTGSFYVTKNHLDPAKRVGYQPASQYGTYNGSLMFHTSEAFNTQKADIAENPAPVEIGGYALATDSSFAAAFANAGGMAMEIDLRGATSLEFSNYWTALGIVRFGRPGWDTRLGPSDGQRDIGTGLGVTFAPTFQEGGNWIRLASVPNRYEGTFAVTFAHPLLVRVSVDYAPKSGAGPKFHDELVVTPDGVLSTVTAAGQAGAWGMTLPLLEDDGAPLVTSATSTDRIARTTYKAGTDEQAFIALGKNVVLAADQPVLSSYGQLRPIRATTDDTAHRTFVYPRSANDPTAEAVRDSFQITANGFQSVVGRVDDTLYVGRTSAGGVGTSIDITGDGQPDATFSVSCGFILQIRGGTIAAIEADRAVTATIGGKSVSLTAYTPVVLDAAALASDAGAGPVPGIPEIGVDGGGVTSDSGVAIGDPMGDRAEDAATRMAEPVPGSPGAAESAAGCSCRSASRGTTAYWLACIPLGIAAALRRRTGPRRHGIGKSCTSLMSGSFGAVSYWQPEAVVCSVAVQFQISTPARSVENPATSQLWSRSLRADQLKHGIMLKRFAGSPLMLAYIPASPKMIGLSMPTNASREGARFGGSVWVVS